MVMVQLGDREKIGEPGRRTGRARKTRVSPFRAPVLSYAQILS